MSRWKYQFTTRHPRDRESKWQVGVSEELCRNFVKNGHDKSHARLMLVREVLEECLLAIYSGWSRPDKEDCFVYVGNPKSDWHKLSPQICVPAPPGMVFLVFVLGDGTVDNWTWRKHADGCPWAPNDITGELIWEHDKS